MTESTLNALVQSAVPKAVNALYLTRDDGAPKSMLALGKRQKIEFPLEVIERQTSTPVAGKSALGVADEDHPQIRRQQPQVSELAHRDRDGLLVAMAARERLESADVAAARALLDKVPAHVFADPVVADMRSVLMPADSIDAQLAEVRRATTAGRAYDAFEHAICIFESSKAPVLLGLLAAYLTDLSAPFKDTLLGCLSDREVCINHDLTMQRLIALLAAEDRELARAAALVLDAGGEGASTALVAALLALPEDRRNDLNRFISFAAGR